MRKSLLFTGSNGFVGNNTIPLLLEKFDIRTLGRGSGYTYNHDLVTDSSAINERYDVVLHAAGKAHSVPKTQSEQDEFYKVNFTGTVNLCKSLSANPPESFVFLSTVAVYGCVTGTDIGEDHPLEGTSAYAHSKILAEEYLREWCKENGVRLLILRPALLAGRNSPGNLGQ
jgi:nucleoside-diphosphate-sugar epimerase